jgi:hypothetical protein
MNYDTRLNEKKGREWRSATLFRQTEIGLITRSLGMPTL